MTPPAPGPQRCWCRNGSRERHKQDEQLFSEPVTTEGDLGPTVLRAGAGHQQPQWSSARDLHHLASGSGGTRVLGEARSTDHGDLRFSTGPRR